MLVPTLYVTLLSHNSYSVSCSVKNIFSRYIEKLGLVIIVCSAYKSSGVAVITGIRIRVRGVSYIYNFNSLVTTKNLDIISSLSVPGTMNDFSRVFIKYIR